MVLILGINIDWVIFYVFVIGVVMVVLVGVLIIMNYGIFDFYVGFIIGIKVFIVVVFGGIGLLFGVMFGGLVLGVVEV